MQKLQSIQRNMQCKVKIINEINIFEICDYTNMVLQIRKKKIYMENLPKEKKNVKKTN